MPSPLNPDALALRIKPRCDFLAAHVGTALDVAAEGFDRNSPEFQVTIHFVIVCAAQALAQLAGTPAAVNALRRTTEHLLAREAEPPSGGANGG